MWFSFIRSLNHPALSHQSRSGAGGNPYRHGDGKPVPSDDSHTAETNRECFHHLSFSYLGTVNLGNYFHSFNSLQILDRKTNGWSPNSELTGVWMVAAGVSSTLVCSSPPPFPSLPFCPWLFSSGQGEFRLQVVCVCVRLSLLLTAQHYHQADETLFCSADTQRYHRDVCVCHQHSAAEWLRRRMWGHWCCD